jgi:hypothetical protein
MYVYVYLHFTAEQNVVRNEVELSLKWVVVGGE